ncbi:hypothetical protein LCGC14_2199290 [marine sediment metagenome]|uniref:Uncharacterized protein n=1 Tax=marine sediment metagenome TaxID=412755 RepID=A0A0F9E4C1_9ZZZZ
MDKLVTSKEFPDPRPDEKLEEYMPRYTRWITKELYSRMVYAINFLLSVSNDNIIEIIKEGNVAGGEGNWRLIIVGDDIKLEHRESGIWQRRGFLYYGA